MILLNNLFLPLDADFSDLMPYVAKELGVKSDMISSAILHKKSVDARHKNDIKFCCSVKVSLKCDENKILKRVKNAVLFREIVYTYKKAELNGRARPVVIGFGPAGMFASLILAKAGLCPIVLERGADVDTRARKINGFFGGGKLDENTNVQFGEGGAGTFSDGKLNTGIKDERIRFVLERFAEYGADKNILTDAKPHIGTDVLRNVVKKLREEIISLGGEVLFNSKVENIKTDNGKITSVILKDREIICDNIVLAIGHSARDTFKMLRDNGLKMEKKPFSVGVRIEHLQCDINRALYGDENGSLALKAADYKLWTHLKNGRGVYSFCMCPGGEVINASSKEGFLAVNGMSNSRRDGINANSAILVNVNPEDLSEDIFSGIYLQEKIEKCAFDIANGAVPVTTVGRFVFGDNTDIGKVKPTVKPNYVLADLNKLFPDFVSNSLKEGILCFDKKIKGFADKEAVLTAPETRSSSPVRIPRGVNMSADIKGLYPCGEGAGYAGGIMSAAVDGIKVAESIIDMFNFA